MGIFSFEFVQAVLVSHIVVGSEKVYNASHFVGRRGRTLLSHKADLPYVLTVTVNVGIVVYIESTTGLG